MLGAATFRAYRTPWPTGSFKPLPGGFLVVRMRLRKLTLGHLVSPMAILLALVTCGVNYASRSIVVILAVLALVSSGMAIDIKGMLSKPANAAKFTNAFIAGYISPAFGARSKTEIDILVSRMFVVRKLDMRIA
jgi:hypothetical protein